MDSKTHSVRCEQCGLISFATSETCKRCGHKLMPPSPENDVTLANIQTGVIKSKSSSGVLSNRTKLIVVAVLIVISLMIGVAFTFHSKKIEQIPTEASSTNEVDPVSLRSRFVEEIKPATEKFAADLFLSCRDDEMKRLQVEAERLNKIMRETEADFTKSNADKVRTLISIRPDVLQVQKDMNVLKEMTPTNMKAQVAGPESDTLFYNVTGGLARNVSQEFVKWWRQESPPQQKMSRDLRKYGFKSIVIGNSVLDGQHLELKE